MGRGVSLREIAKQAGVSLSAASMILNGKENYCSEATRERVRAVATQLGYKTNFGYKLMQGKPTRTVAIMNSMPQMNSETHIKSLIMKLLSLFDQEGYTAYCGTYSDDPGRNLDKTRELVGRGVESFIFLGEPFGSTQIIEWLRQHKIQYLANHNKFDRFVHFATEIGAEAEFRYIISCVGDNFRLVCQAKEAQGGGRGNPRLQALTAIFPELGMEQILERYVYCSPDISFYVNDYPRAARLSGYDSTRELLNKEPGLKAIVYMNDCFAIGGGMFLMEQKRQDLLLCGFNNDDAIQAFPLPITSVEFELDILAAALVRHALSPEPCTRIIPPLFHIRTPASPAQYPPWSDTVTHADVFIQQQSPLLVQPN